MTRLALALVCSAVTLGAASSAGGFIFPRQLCVDAGFAFGCFKTIQEAVDAATPGDVISIRPGVYKETVIISAAKKGITLRGTVPAGKGGVVIDSFGLTGDTISIEADDVTIKDLTIRNSGQDEFDDDANGVAVDPNNDGSGGARTRISRVRILIPENDCIDINRGGDRSVVENSWLLNCENEGVDLDREDNGDPSSDGPDDVVIRGNQIMGVEADGIDGDADDLLVKGNTITRTDAECIEIDGADARVENNQLELCDNDAVDVVGDRAVVHGNVIRVTSEESSGCTEEGIDVNGDRPTVTDNDIDGTAGDGIDIFCPDDPTAACTGGKVARNIIRRTQDTCEGIEVDVFDIPPSSFFLVEENKTLGGADMGIEINGDRVKILNNLVADNGDDSDDDGIDVEGDWNIIAGNTATNNFDDGIDVEGDNNLIKHNRANDNGEDGIDINDSDSDGNKVIANTAWDNSDEGIDVSEDVTDTLVKLNKAGGNRVDFCDDGIGTNALLNDFDTTSNGPCAP